MEKQIDKLPAELQGLVLAKVAQQLPALGQAIGELVDEVVSSGWTHDPERDAFMKEGEQVMVKVLWRALVESAA